MKSDLDIVLEMKSFLKRTFEELYENEEKFNLTEKMDLCRSFAAVVAAEIALEKKIGVAGEIIPKQNTGHHAVPQKKSSVLAGKN